MVDNLDVAGDVVLGIDLGTSFSTAAAFVDGKLRFAVDGRGEACIPSVVHFPKGGRPIVGFEAARQRAADPTNTVSAIKRLLGCGPDSPELRVVQASAAYKIGSHGSSVTISTRKGELSPAEIASMIFAHVKHRAELMFGQRVNKCVLTLAVKSSERTRSATILAAKSAGLDVIGTIEEPCAAALCNGLDDFEGERVFLVYDFGGGTFDVSVVEQRNREFRVLRAGGDELLGGDDLDFALAKRVASHVWEARRIDVTKDAVRWDRIQVACEKAKRGLSATSETRLRIEDAIPGARGSGDIDLLLQRHDAEMCWSELVARSMRSVAETMVSAGVRPELLAGVVLAGGTTFVPLVQQQVTRVLRRPYIKTRDPQTSVASGAALLGAKQINLLQ